MLVGNEEQTKDGVESLPNETDQVYNDFPSFSLGIEFELSCGEKDVEVPARKSDKLVEKSDKAVEKSLRAMVKSDKAVEMNLNEEIEFHEDDWLKVDDIVARSLAKNQEDVVSPCNEGRIDFLEEVELKDDVWEKVVEVTAAIEAETEIEEGNARIIDIDDETPDINLKRQKKPGVLLQSPWVNEFDSTSGTKKRVVKGTFAFPVGVGPPMAHDVDAFELWFNKGLDGVESLPNETDQMLAGNKEEMKDGVERLPDETDKMLDGNEEQTKDGVERLPDETDKMLDGNKEQTKDGVESLPDETDQVYNDFPSFSLGIEFELSCGEKDVEVPVRKSDKSVEKSDKAVEKSLRAVVKSDKAVEMNLNEEIEFHEDDWLKVDDIVARSLAKNQEDVVSPCNEGRIDFLEEVELKDDVWEKVVEVTAAIEAETEIEEGNARIIDIEAETPDMHLKRQKKPGVLLQSPWVNEFDSTSGTKKRVVKGTFAFPVGVGPPMAHDVDAFELWFNKGLVVRKALVLEAIKPFSDIIPHLLFHTGFFEGKGISEEEALKPLVVKMVPKLPQQNNGGDYGIYVIKYAQYFINGMLNEMPKSFNVPHLRRNLAAQLYAYGKKKQEEEYDTDNEWVSKEME
ncbi:Ulp1 protease family, C-terminal catalytic domain containing [Olea europaea subsp. europaea]|uniref:Ulp1 protease family, C-terminal catalytic domain containing n=1 Tax=Olea europaea subsp. europaea TaxID=158383 RepID=A0A8S0SMK6_OLEEU|nr:Ulp1 protease family, C-terminal catalytic domain containing [Olea europaea subsp. europaea]